MPTSVSPSTRTTRGTWGSWWTEQATNSLASHQPVLHAMDLHQGDEASNDSTEVMGYQNDHLHQWHVDNVRLQSRGGPIFGSPCLLLRVPDIYHKLGEITFNTSSRNRIFGTDGRLSKHPAQAPSEKLWQICREAGHILTCQVVWACQLSQFIGKLNAAPHRQFRCPPCSTMLFRAICKKPYPWGARTTIRRCTLGQKPWRNWTGGNITWPIGMGGPLSWDQFR